MDCKEIWIYIIIPLICAFVGGAITFFGVLCTIKHEKVKNKENEKLRYKPYLKLSYEKGYENIRLQESIKHTFDQDNIDFDKTKFFYSYIIETMNIMNSSNAECILKEIIIDGARYKLNETFLLKNEPINLITTGNRYINSKDLIKNIYISASDVLGHIYYYKCEFKTEYDKLQAETEYENGKKLKILMPKFTITNIGLPQDKI